MARTNLTALYIILGLFGGILLLCCCCACCAESHPQRLKKRDFPEKLTRAHPDEKLDAALRREFNRRLLAKLEERLRHDSDGPGPRPGHNHHDEPVFVTYHVHGSFVKHWVLLAYGTKYEIRQVTRLTTDNNRPAGARAQAQARDPTSPPSSALDSGNHNVDLERGESRYDKDTKGDDSSYGLDGIKMETTHPDPDPDPEWFHIGVLGNWTYQYRVSPCTVDEERYRRAVAPDIEAWSPHEFSLNMIGWTPKSKDQVFVAVRNALQNHPSSLRDPIAFLRAVTADVVKTKAPDWDLFSRNTTTSYNWMNIDSRVTRAAIAATWVRHVEAMRAYAGRDQEVLEQNLARARQFIWDNEAAYVKYGNIVVDRHEGEPKCVDSTYTFGKREGQKNSTSRSSGGGGGGGGGDCGGGGGGGGCSG